MFPNVFLIADHHFGHKNSLSFKRSDGSLLRPEFSSVEEMNETMIERHNSRVRPGDKTYFLGDVAVCNSSLFDSIMSRLNGAKVLIRGNHDNLKLSSYVKWFKDIRGSHQLDKFILSHIPIHSDSIPEWCPGNIHGHLHYRCVMVGDPDFFFEETGAFLEKMKDPRYTCVSVEQTNYTPVSLEEIRSKR